MKQMMNKAFNALMNLQSFCLTDEEILNIHVLLNGARLESARGIKFEGGIK
jgi:hypothetical protein